MVDVRPLLFANALALMLLVTAGFASVHNHLPAAEQFTATPPEPVEIPAIAGADTTTPVDINRSQKDRPSPPATATETAPPPKPEQKPSVTEVSAFIAPETTPYPVSAPVPVEAQNVQPEVLQEPTPEPPTTGDLVIRSNVVGDQVTINGKDYGATRLDLELAPGNYDIRIEKPGYQPWRTELALEAGDAHTLVGRLEALTHVNYRNGEWVGGIQTGDGSWQDETGLRYEGHFINGKFDGQGTAWYADGSRYEGDWNDGARHGEGRWRSADDTTYTGQFRNDQFHGKGTLALANGDILTGNWLAGQLSGRGSLTSADGMLYVGSFRNGEFHGQGVLTYPDGRTYEGEFSNGAFHGKGSEVFADGKRYNGQYMEGQFHGKGLLQNPNGSSIEATFRHGEPYGQVRLTTAAGEIFTARTTEPGVCYRDKSYRATQCPALEGW